MQLWQWGETLHATSLFAFVGMLQETLHATSVPVLPAAIERVNYFPNKISFAQLRTLFLLNLPHFAMKSEFGGIDLGNHDFEQQ